MRGTEGSIFIAPGEQCLPGNEALHLEILERVYEILHLQPDDAGKPAE